MKTRWKDPSDNWTINGKKITSSENLDLIRETLERQGSILVKRWFYRGASGPEYKIFDIYEDVISFLNNECYAGDAIDIWSLWNICKDEERLVEGKCPDENGLTPLGGAY